MRRWTSYGILILCASVLFACGNKADKTETYTKDAQMAEQQDTNINKDSSENKDTTSEEENDKKVDANTTEEKQQTASTTDNAKGATSNTTTPPPVVAEKPVESERISKVTISIDTKTILNNMDKVAENKKAYVPTDGWILAPITVEIQSGDTVFDILSRVTRERRIHMEFQGANQNIYNSVYIQGIGQLYEFDCGELSGWMYTINGAYVSKGASGVNVEDGMNIEWRYTCDLGRDLGL